MAIAPARQTKAKPGGFAVRNTNRADVVLGDQSPAAAQGQPPNVPAPATRARSGRKGKALQLWMRDDQWARLETEHHATGAAVSELIRRAIDQTYP